MTLTLQEIEFLAENEQVTIIPSIRMNALRLMEVLFYPFTLVEILWTVTLVLLND